VIIISTLTGGLKSRRIKKRLKFESFFLYIQTSSLLESITAYAVVDESFA
jgi:hypothetical protein